MILILRLILAVTFFAILWIPAWWLTGQLRDLKAPGVFRTLIALGLAVIGYLTFVNLAGRLLEQSILPVWMYFGLNLALVVYLVARFGKSLWHGQLRVGTWFLPVAVAVILAIPQWLLAVSTNYWDEAASSAIHLTAPNQFSEGVFPPRHNAFPDIPLKYHYAFTMLSGTVKWLTGLSSNVSIDVVSTGIWLFIFLFAYGWLRQIGISRLSSLWGGGAILLGGGLSWLYTQRLETYSAFQKNPSAEYLTHSYDAQLNWWGNLTKVMGNQNAHLRNDDDSLSSLPLDVVNYFQQHTVALGMALTILALFLFMRWQQHHSFSWHYLIINILTFSFLFLAHAVFGAVACISAGLFLVVSWLRQRQRLSLINALLFTAGVTLMAFLHGGLFLTGSEYGSSAVVAWRGWFGYWEGGWWSMLHWHLAGFGLPLLLTLIAVLVVWRNRDSIPAEQKYFLLLIGLFGLLSYLVPQQFYYSYTHLPGEWSTEISKFFFCTNFSFALLSVFAINRLKSHWRWLVVPVFFTIIIDPLAVSYAGSFSADGDWRGFYGSPYAHEGGRNKMDMGSALANLKEGNEDIYFDASTDERKHGYLNELLVHGGSIFTLTPSRFERSGQGFRLDQKVVAEKYRLNSQMARLLPGAAERSGCDWYYTRSFEDLALAPLIVRSRFRKLVADSIFVKKHEAGPRALYEIIDPSIDLDQGIEEYWSPKMILQSHTDWNGDGTKDLIFFDYQQHQFIMKESAIEFPQWPKNEFPMIFVASFPGEASVDFLLGRMADTHYEINESGVVEFSGIHWSYWDSYSDYWQNEYQHWYWDKDIPFVADLNKDGFERHVAYRYGTQEWFQAPNRALSGPAMAENLLPIPFGGRFLEGSGGDLGLWSIRTGEIRLKSIATEREAIFEWGGLPGDIMVPGDYTGDGYDEIAIWQRHSQTWFWKRAPDGPIANATFGTETSIPLPADYNNDGLLDLAYWEPTDRKIFVSFDFGRSIGQTVKVPSNAIPAFVNMY